jgi:hypothetical protein
MGNPLDTINGAITAGFVITVVLVVLLMLV